MDKALVAQQQASELLLAFQEASIIAKDVVDTLNATFHLKELLELANKNSFIALMYYELICNINYVLLMPYSVNPVGTLDTGLSATWSEITGNTKGVTFEFTPREKLAAVAFCFQVQAAKMHDMVSTDILGTFMQSTGAAQIAQDAINAFAGSGSYRK